ncbi:MAG TPA: hypothetical protein VFG02_04195 [Nitrospirota bacterium]|nr:hypothetical protein [Nitrospirota bacterium]
MKKWGNILLGVWLIVTGLISLAGLSFRGSYTIQALLAVAAGALLILADWKANISGRIADIILGIWLVVMGLIPLLDIRFRESHTVLGLLALGAGVLVLIRR